MEQGLGFHHTLKMVNESSTDREIVHVDRSAVITAFRRMAPVITNIRKRMQGSTNNKVWQLSRKHQTEQFMVILGKLK